MRPYLLVVLVVPMAMAACGDDGGHGHLADAPPAISDAPISDAPIAAILPVTLTVTRNGAPAAGIHTYFLADNNTVVATVDTDATGVASAVMPDGGSVTALDPFPALAVPTFVRALVTPVGNNELRTFLGVKPGDHLVLTQNDPPVITFTLNAPADPNANTYDVLTSCGSSSISPGGGGSGSGSAAPGGVITLAGCHGTADILIVAKQINTEVTTTVSALYHPAVTLTDGGTVDLTQDTYQALTDVMFTYMNAPDATLTVAHSLVTSRGALAPLIGNGNASVTIAEPTIAGAKSIVDTRLFQSAAHHVVDAGPFAASYTLDLMGLLLPDLSGRPQYNPTTKKVSWIEEPTGAAPDLTITALDVSRGERRWHWTVAAPYTPGELKLPTLPADVADWTPTADDGVSVNELINAQVPGHYDAVRAHIHDLHGAIAGDDFSGFGAGLTGHVVAVQMRNLQGAVRRAKR